MFLSIYGKSFQVLMKKPLRLWGLSLLALFLESAAMILCGVAIPILGIAVSLLITVSMTMIYLYGFRGEEVYSAQLFTCFRDFGVVKRVLAGMGWMLLWLFLWALIPIAGPIIAIVKAYSWRLTPYILVNEPDVAPTDAIKVSAERTKGYRGQMFLADFVVYIIVFLTQSILLLLGQIPFIGHFFSTVSVLLGLVIAALLPLFTGLVQAAFYEEIENAHRNGTPAPGAPTFAQVSAAANAAAATLSGENGSDGQEPEQKQ